MQNQELGGASRPLAVRKASIQLRVSELRKALAAAERAEAEVDVLIEEQERARERDWQNETYVVEPGAVRPPGGRSA